VLRKKPKLWLLLPLAAILYVYVIWTLGTSTTFTTCIEDETAAASQQTKKSSPPALLSIIDNAALSSRCALHVAYVFRDLVTAVATVLIAFFTFILYGATADLWAAGEEQRKLSEDTAIRQLRAYVSMPSIRSLALVDASQQVVRWRITPLWENSGSTETKGFTNHVSWQAFPTGKPDSIGFPDLWRPGDPRIAVPIVVGPKTIIVAESVDVPVSRILATTQAGGHIYIWGWAEYSDVFAPKTPKHRTEFCFYLRWTGDPAIPDSNNFEYRFHTAFNGADGETYRKPAARQ
jgi:hypothetical protein